MTKLKIEDQGVIYRNPLPGHRVINAFFPSLHQLDDGELLCVLRGGGAMYSPDGMLEIFRSAGDGSWERQGPIRNSNEDGIQYNYAFGDLTSLRNGELVLRILRADQTDPNRLAYNPKTQGLMPLETCYMRSTDRGRTWSDLVIADVAPHFDNSMEPASLGPVVELDDETWFQVFETWKKYDNAGPFELNLYGLFSRDGGRTWGERVDIAVGKSEDLSYSHGIPVRRDDGRLCLSVWQAESQLQKYFGLSMVTSVDQTARKWSRPRLLGIPGQTSCAVDMGHNRMLIVYSHREDTDHPGIKVARSNDAGESFDVSKPLVIWDAYGKEALGVARTSTYPSSHDAIAYGAPRIIRLDANHAMVTYWCTQGADSHCRCCTIRLL